MRRSTPRSARPDAAGARGLFGDATPSADVAAKAFVGRFQSTDAYGTMVGSYAGDSGDYDIVNHKIEAAYHRFVIVLGWPMDKFFKVLANVLTLKMDVSRYSFGLLGRTYDAGRLSNGPLEDMDMRDYHYIIGDRPCR